MSKPIAIIRKVEDSPDWLDQRLVEAYYHTSYQVSAMPFPAIRIGRLDPLLADWLEERHFQSFVFITAWNPFSRLRSLRENKRRNNQLRADLSTLARAVHSGVGIGDNNDWPPEESFWALDIDAEEAVRLGRKYGQNALVWWEKGGLPELWWL